MNQVKTCFYKILNKIRFPYGTDTDTVMLREK